MYLLKILLINSFFICLGFSQSSIQSKNVINPDKFSDDFIGIGISKNSIKLKSIKHAKLKALKNLSESIEMQIKSILVHMKLDIDSVVIKSLKKKMYIFTELSIKRVHYEILDYNFYNKKHEYRILARKNKKEFYKEQLVDFNEFFKMKIEDVIQRMEDKSNE